MLDIVERFLRWSARIVAEEIRNVQKRDEVRFDERLRLVEELARDARDVAGEALDKTIVDEFIHDGDVHRPSV